MEVTMEYDLKIVGARIIDGSGAPAFDGAVGVRDGRIVAVGDAPGDAAEVIDAAGAVVSPGFIDTHTHYDAQVFWDRMLSPSVYHGVTTVLSGNCGFTLAPLTGQQEDTDYLMAMLARVEGMPLATLNASINPTWTTFGEFLDKIDGSIAINTAFLVGHSALRRIVMGDRAVGHEATAEEIAAMADLLRRSLAEGGAGFSTSMGIAHSDHEGQPVPSRWATVDEILELSAVVKDYPGTWLEFNPPSGTTERNEISTAMSLAGQRSVNWNAVIVRSYRRDMLDAQLEVGRYAAERGAKVYGLVPAVPIKNVINLRTGIQIDLLEGWSDFLHLPDEEKLVALADPEVRARLRAGAASGPKVSLPADFGVVRIEYVRSAKNARWIGSTLREYADHQGKEIFDALFDLAIEEQLWLSFSPPGLGEDEESWAMRPDVWRDEHCLLGGSDAGAHLDTINTFALSTQLLGEGVRTRGLMPLEEAVRRITSLPCQAFGLTGRGLIENGAAADLVIFDPSTIDCGPMSMRTDLPGGEARLYADAVGVHHVIVNGVPVAANNKPTGRVGGKVLRSGSDTHTVPLI